MGENGDDMKETDDDTKETDDDTKETDDEKEKEDSPEVCIEYLSYVLYLSIFLIHINRKIKVKLLPRICLGNFWFHLQNLHNFFS